MLNTQRLNLVSENTDIKNSKYTLIGVPFDSTVWSIPGQRLAPNNIREHILMQESHNILNKVYDDGNLTLPHGNAKKMLKITQENLEHILEINKNIIPIHLGGEHTITYAPLKALSKIHKNIQLISFDAHLDLKDTQINEKIGHSTIIKRIYEDITQHIKIIGARTSDKQEQQIQKQLKNINTNNPTYITIDIDYFDPSIAPGVGDPEINGANYQQFKEIFKSLKLKNIIGIDIVEVNPLIEKHITCTLAAKLIIDFMIGNLYE
jgi:agmatinase